MASVSIKRADGATAELDSAALEGLRARLHGSLVLPGSPEYDTTRAIWNAMIDRRPAAIVRAADASDVVHAVGFARDHHLALAIRGGGHNIAGNAVCEGGLMLDLSPMKKVTIDAKTRRAKVEPGVLLGEFDRAAQAHGLVTPTGINATTGIAGLTLGGGFGWISRRFGLTADNLVGADIVTGAGTRLHASATENADLFWGIRGAGANLGVVTEFEYQLHPLGPQVYAGLIVHPFANAKTLFEAYRKITAAAPEELTIWVVLRKAPPLPFLPESVHGKEVMVIAFCYSGDPAKGEQAIAPLRALGKPLGEMVAAMPFTDWQQAFDPLLTPGARNYWKSQNFLQLDDGAIDAILAAVNKLPTEECEAFVGHLGGAVNRVSGDAIAYPHRDVNYVLNVHTRWRNADDDRRCIAWARDLFEATKPFATGGVYVNFMPEDETDRVAKGAYGKNYDRVASLKAKYDPTNLFRMNQNVRPSA
jgi:FAD/FMN-containing dehydrogenase